MHNRSQSEQRDEYRWRHDVALVRILVADLVLVDAAGARKILADELRKIVDSERKEG